MSLRSTSKACGRSHLGVACRALATLLLIGVGSTAGEERQPITLIFDTDIGNDVDDVLALGMIHSLASRGECALAAVTITKDHPLSAPFVDAVNTFYGRGEVPIGIVHQGVTPEPSKFTGLADAKNGDHLRYPHDLASGAAPDAVALLRRTLADAEDGSVVIVQVGFSTNLARLLKSPPDSFSVLSGVDLIKQKVRLLSVMAGSFGPESESPQAEYNIKMDVASAQALCTDWPTPIVFSGLEVGLAVTFPAECIEKDFAYVPHHPLAEAYRLYEPPPHNRPTWDLTSVLFAVRPDAGYFNLSPPGRVEVSKDGTTKFHPVPAGRHRYLILNSNQRDLVRQALIELASQAPDAHRPPPASPQTR